MHYMQYMNHNYSPERGRRKERERERERRKQMNEMRKD